MTKEERKNVKNGIWLCGRCANEIDVTPDSYPIDLLYTWKSQAETGNLSLSDSLPRFLPMFRNVIFYGIMILQSQKIKSEYSLTGARFRSSMAKMNKFSQAWNRF
ncbi:hypothetical protein AM592_12350 [Bacillus gobiensis]|uniref:Uncharacterized protein n=1 Tax=Bacillus gobiensis TaxID=1441095 RepID=A0A0M4FUY0_9BACI|nr:hypothetical protein AM592_12350 [Bacillus gobiensis]